MNSKCSWTNDVQKEVVSNFWQQHVLFVYLIIAKVPILFKLVEYVV